MCYKMYKIIILFFILTGVVFSGTDGTIRGQVVDTEGEPVIGAQVVIKKNGLGAAVDVDGNYLLLNIPVGSYELTVQMIGYQTVVIENVSVTMDQTTWLNFTLSMAAIEGDVVYVTGEKPLVEKGATSKKITMDKEAIESLPIRNVSELYNLQSGVVKVESRSQGIPDHEERGLQEVHVRGGRSGEIAYMIDGMYIRNPIYGGIGNGTRLNKFAIQEFDWQPGGFNAEYGDAMSAVSNLHTMTGGTTYSFKFNYETSLLGEALGSLYDELRDYNDYNFGIGGPLIPGWDKIKFWFSSQSTSNGAYKVYKFDEHIYQFGDPYGSNPEYVFQYEIDQMMGDYEVYPFLIPGDPNWEQNRVNYTLPWDNTAGYRAFGFDYTDDYFFKLNFDFSSQFKINLSYWNVTAHRKNFGYNTFLYWDEGQNEIFRDTERLAIEINHTINPTTFYTLRLSQFIQDQFIGVRWQDSDDDGFPDWFEWSQPLGKADYSDPKNPNMIPFLYSEQGDSIFYIAQDGIGPDAFTSGWYYGAEPGNYNWSATDRFEDVNNNGYYDFGDKLIEDVNNNGLFDPPPLVEKSVYRDGSYWLTPEMYVSYEDFYDTRGAYLNYEGLDPYTALNPFLQYLGYWVTSDPYSPTALLNPFGTYRPLYFVDWNEERTFGGSDRFFSTSRALTNEIRLDFTKQFTDRWRARFGIDYKEHELNFYEVEEPWLDALASRQRFAEQWDDYGVDGQEWQTADCPYLDYGEGNGVWDGDTTMVNPCSITPETPEGVLVYYPGERYDDFNGNNRWDDFVQPKELALYWQNTYEVPWMVINAGIRIDAVNYQTKIWADDKGDFSPYVPWFYYDCGSDLDVNGNPVCPGDPGDQTNDPNQLNGQKDEGEAVTDNIADVNNFTNVIFRDSEWLYKVSPRLGISHVISDGATFVFNYGMYYQTPIYEYIYRNVSKLEDPGQAFEDAERAGIGIGNATMSAGRTSAYEVGFNVELNKSSAIQVALWVKDMDQLTTASSYNSGIYEYKVAKNGDFGTAIGYDFTLELRGKYLNSTIQYTYSTAKASSEYEEAAFGSVEVDAPMQEFLMPYDRTHDLTMSLYTSKLPWGINAGLTGYFQSGYPYTALYQVGADKPIEDLKNKNGMRSPNTMHLDMSISKSIKIGRSSLAFGVNIFNLFDKPYSIDVHRLTGKVDDPGRYYTRKIGEDYSHSYYDRPWMRSSNREINFFVEIGFE